jgi:hypothetical protein
MPPRVVPTNEFGYRIGEGHHCAKTPDAVVNQIRELHENPMHPLGYRRLSLMFGIPVGTIKKWCRYERRGQVAKGWRTVKEVSNVES